MFPSYLSASYDFDTIFSLSTICDKCDSKDEEILRKEETIDTLIKSISKTYKFILASMVTEFVFIFDFRFFSCCFCRYCRLCSRNKDICNNCSN